MNLILVGSGSVVRTTGDESSGDGDVLTVQLDTYQAKHCINVLHLQVGSTVRIGIRNGPQGTGVVYSIDCKNKNKPSVFIRLNNHQFSYLLSLNRCETSNSLSSLRPSSPPIDILVAIPRPKVIDKLLQHLATLGVGRIILVCTERVEKSYLSSPRLTKQGIFTSLQLGAEQSTSTYFPEVYVYASWKRFVERLYSNHIRLGMRLLIAHVDHDYNQDPLSSIASFNLHKHDGDSVMIAIGPEGGWIASEVEDLVKMGFSKFSIGERILTCDTAATLIIGQLQLLLYDKSLRNGISPVCSLQPLSDINVDDGVVIQLPQRYHNRDNYSSTNNNVNDVNNSKHNNNNNDITTCNCDTTSITHTAGTTNNSTTTTTANFTKTNSVQHL